MSANGELLLDQAIVDGDKLAAACEDEGYDMPAVKNK